MSGDELTVLIVSAVLALIGWARWFSMVTSVNRLAGGGGIRVALGTAPPTCVVVLVLLLRNLAADDVRDAPRYMFLYSVLGAAWIAWATELFSLPGVSARDDAVERRNPAAACAVVGTLLALTFSFAGANFGNGPGWWVVVFCALLSTGGLLLVWLLIQAGSDVLETITVERDTATGVRLGCALAAAGLVLGRAVAGDWHSAGQTLQDFGQYAWPVLAIVAVETGLGRLMRPTPERLRTPLLTAGVLPGLAYVVAAACYVWSRGWW